MITIKMRIMETNSMLLQYHVNNTAGEDTGEVWSRVLSKFIDEHRKENVVHSVGKRSRG